MVRTKNELFQFVCVAKNHQARLQAPNAVANPITVHDHEWAYCPSGDETGHEWKATGGIRLDEVIKRRGLS